MKREYRLPTVDQYAFIHLCLDDGEELTGEAIDTVIHDYNRAMGQIKANDGLPQKDWNKVLDLYRQGHGISEVNHAKLGKAQSWLLHELDKSDSRFAAKKEPITDDK
jgi:hypothetical protein